MTRRRTFSLLPSFFFVELRLGAEFFVSTTTTVSGTYIRPLYDGVVRGISGPLVLGGGQTKTPEKADTTVTPR